jgi:hypothetical protein
LPLTSPAPPPAIAIGTFRRECVSLSLMPLPYTISEWSRSEPSPSFVFASLSRNF